MKKSNTLSWILYFVIQTMAVIAVWGDRWLPAIFLIVLAWTIYDADLRDKSFNLTIVNNPPIKDPNANNNN